ncbi:MerR family transcriptional regulator [bacterium]|nr:MerR family transcriptional regulator [bacterium]
MYTPKQFSEKIGVTVHTLQRWDREGRLVAKRTLTNRRYYTDEDIIKVLRYLPKDALAHDTQSPHPTEPNA